MYVLFEGIDGVGKSTQIEILAQKFKNGAGENSGKTAGDLKFNPKNVVLTREPGGSELGTHLREILLSGKFNLSSRAEALLFLADRAEHFNKVVKPNLDGLVLSDRGFISGIAYAMANDENADINELIALNKFALGERLPDKIVLFLSDENLTRERLKSRGSTDAVEARGLKYLMRVQNFMKIACEKCGADTLVIDAGLEIEKIGEKIENFIFFNVK